MRQHDALGVQQVTEHEIINMTAMRRDIDKRVGIVEFSNTIQAANIDAAVDALPEPSEKIKNRRIVL